MPLRFCDLLYALLDDFEPHAFHEGESADRWRVFFKTPEQRDAATAAVRTFLGDRLLAVSTVNVPDEEWARRSQADLTAVRIGRIVVAPPGMTPQVFSICRPITSSQNPSASATRPTTSS